MDVRWIGSTGRRVLVSICDRYSSVFFCCFITWTLESHTYCIHDMNLGTHVFFVGDSAQCIYQFRGAKSANLMKLDCIDYQLTKSWRFGPNIAKIANMYVLLFPFFFCTRIEN